jgi:hypothetical protein
MVHKVAFVLVVVGALNWGLVGLSDFNVVTYLLDMVGQSMLEDFVYLLVGFSAVVLLFTHKSSCCMCNPGCSCDMPMENGKSKKRKK